MVHANLMKSKEMLPYDNRPPCLQLLFFAGNHTMERHSLGFTFFLLLAVNIAQAQFGDFNWAKLTEGQTKDLQNRIARQQIGGQECPDEQLSFEMVTGYVYTAPADMLDSQPGTLMLTDCIDTCRKNSSCRSINYETGLCVLFASNADDGAGKILGDDFKRRIFQAPSGFSDFFSFTQLVRRFEK